MIASIGIAPLSFPLLLPPLPPPSLSLSLSLLLTLALAQIHIHITWAQYIPTQTTALVLASLSLSLPHVINALRWAHVAGDYRRNPLSQPVSYGLILTAMNRTRGEDQEAIEDRYIATDPALDQNLVGNVEYE